MTTNASTAVRIFLFLLFLFLLLAFVCCQHETDSIFLKAFFQFQANTPLKIHFVM